MQEPWFMVYTGQSCTSPVSIVHTVGSSRPVRWCAGAVCTISLAHRYLPTTVHLMKCSSSAPSSPETCSVQNAQPCPFPTCLYVWTRSPAKCDAVASQQCGFYPMETHGTSPSGVGGRSRCHQRHSQAARSMCAERLRCPCQLSMPCLLCRVALICQPCQSTAA